MKVSNSRCRGLVVELAPTPEQVELFWKYARLRRRAKNFLVAFSRSRFQQALWRACRSYASEHDLDPVEVRKQWADKDKGRKLLQENGFEYKVEKPAAYDLTTQWLRRRRNRWMGDNSKARKEACQNFRQAEQNFFDSASGRRKGRPVGPPQFESRFKGRPSFSLQVQSKKTTKGDHNATVLVSKGTKVKGLGVLSHDGLKVAKVGIVRWKEDPRKRIHGGKITLMTIWEKAGKWYATLRVSEMPAPILPKDRNEGSVGVDLNTGANGIVLSTGKKFPVPPRLEELHEEIRRHQRRHRKKRAPRRAKNGQPGRQPSNNWKKQKTKLARIHAEAARVREDWLHKVTTWIAENYRIVVIEDLQPSNMTRSARGTVEHPGKNVRAKATLNRKILQAGFGIFRNFLSYKLEQTGGLLVVIDRFFPSSQLCNRCGWRHEENLGLSVRVFRCGGCGLVECRDRNAGKNVRRVYEDTTMAEAISNGGGERPRDDASHPKLWTGRPLMEGHVLSIQVARKNRRAGKKQERVESKTSSVRAASC